MMQKLATTILCTFVLFATGCSSADRVSQTGPGKIIKSQPIGNNLTVTLSNEEGQLKHGDEELLLTFTDASGKFVDVGVVPLNFHMPAMGTMPVMNDPATFTTTDTPGVYRGKVKLEMAGEWQTQISYEGAAGKGKTSFPVIAQ